MSPVLRALFLVFCGLAGFLTCLSSAFAQRAPGYRQGYLLDVEIEKEESFSDIFLNVAPAPRSTVHESIFNQPLSKEFQEKYREKFGQLDTESIVYQNPRISNFEVSRRANFAEERQNIERRSFAEYMTKRLAEWHVDNYFKTEPTMRPVYEAKEKLSNIQVEVAQDVRLDMRYTLAGNTLDVLILNPWFVESKVAIEMDPKAFGPGQVQETKLWLKSQAQKNLRLDTSVAFNDGIVAGELIRSWRSAWVTSMGASTFFRASGTSTREHRYFVGAGKSY